MFVFSTSENMSLKWSIAVGGRDIRLQSLRPPQISITFLPGTSLGTTYTAWRRRRLVIRNHQLSSSSYSSQDNVFHALISQLNSLDLLAPALGFTTALAILYNSKTTASRRQRPRVIGDWSLFASPTPFNRFVKLRCASLLLEDAIERLVKEDGHPVSFNRGRIQQIPYLNDYTDDVLQKELCYQRICVNTDDGGVVSLDWPANLELTKEHGLDTTILIVPGTVDGSMDENIRSFVYECLKRGSFPIVMNPRGCARSPMTTPRLFTAADSDDICTTVQFINRARPWTTLMGVGFGYGANMLTKYLAEVGEETPLTAATCIDNPFDLNHLFADQNFTSGLIDILKTNKELFQGRSKGFNVEKALQAITLQDFEEAISMVSYGFDSIKEFYVNSSTRDVVGNVKIPLLFIQNDNAVLPISIPRSSIAENSFTSLLICSFPAHDKSTTEISAVSWCQHLVIEWLTAVEFGLLKGRHPLLEDTDVTINPTKRLRLMDASDGDASYPKKMLKRSDAYVYSSSGPGSQQNSKAEGKESIKEINGMVTQTNLADTELAKEGDIALVDSERGKLLQTTEVVMKMLDGTMPDTLSEEQKNKVLTAVGQGETLMNALQNAVPEDVRGKLTSVVTEIMQNQNKNLNGLSSTSHFPDVTSELNTKKPEKASLSSPEKEPNTSNHNKGDTILVEDPNNHPSKNDAPGGGEEPKAHTLGNSEKSDDSSQLQSTSNQGGDTLNSAKSSHDELRSDSQSADFSKEKAAQSSDFPESDSSDMPEVSTRAERSGSSEDQTSEQVKLGHEGETTHSDTKEEKDNQQKDEKDAQHSTDETSISTPRTEERSSPSASSSENQLTEKGGNQKKEESSAYPVPSQRSSDSPSFSVTQALDALTGMDDSTQVAVNSVFSVIEDMITQLEGNRDDESAIGVENKVEDVVTDSASNKHHTEIELDLQQKGDRTSNMTAEPNELGNHQQSMSIRKLSAEKDDEVRVLDNNRNDIPNSLTKLPFGNSLYDHYLQNYLMSDMRNQKSLDSDATNELFLDYIPEEGRWKLLEQSGNGRNYVDDAKSHEDIDINVQSPQPSDVEYNDDIIEPAYVIVDAESDWDPDGEYKKTSNTKEKLEFGDDTSVALMQLVKENILNSLKVEVCRKIRATDMEDMAPMLKKELEHVANTISQAVVHGKDNIISSDGEDLVGPGTLQAERILDAISSAFHSTIYMKKIIPVGIVIGSCLASLRKTFNVAAADSVGNNEAMRDVVNNTQKGYHLQADRIVADQIPPDKVDKNNNFYSLDDGYKEKDVSSSLTSDTVMVGAVTAALGASALLVHQQDSYSDGVESSGSSSLSFNQQENHQEPGKLKKEMSKSSDHNIVTSLAEKAMSVAGPVVPTKEGGEVDQDRLVALLADLGQKGGMLKLVGKVALLWGGIRGAMSLTDKLISFLHLAERPLFQRILGFVFMVLVLWTPVVVPLLPTLVQNWASHDSSKIAEFACVIGLYASVMVLIVLWGKRIRGYEDPLEGYGLQWTSTTQIRNFLWGLIGGVMLVLLIQSVNVLLGFVCVSWPSVPSSRDAVTLLKLFGKVLTFVGQGLVTATAVALVEELLFRSWLPEEITVDLGYNQGIILSGLAFSLSQWSLKAIPGLWLLSLGLAGARQRCQGSLSLPIGLRAGIMASSFVLKAGHFLTYQSTTYPSWVNGGDPFKPFNNIVGLSVALLWALLLYPKKPQNKEILKRTLTE